MMKIALEFTYHTDIIAVPDDIGNQIKKCQCAFDKWLYDKENRHDYWVLKDGKKTAVSFDTMAFVNYLNHFYLSDSEDKVIVLEEDSVDIPKGITILFF